VQGYSDDNDRSEGDFDDRVPAIPRKAVGLDRRVRCRSRNAPGPALAADPHTDASQSDVGHDVAHEDAHADGAYGDSGHNCSHADQPAVGVTMTDRDNLPAPGLPDESPWEGVDNPRKRAFLTALAELGTRVAAADAAGVHRTVLYTRTWAEDEAFQRALKVADRLAADRLEAEAYRRAVHGVERPAGWYRGKPGGMVREYSDNLLMFKLKGALPEKYAARLELKGGLANIDVSQLPDAALERLLAGEHPLSVLASLAEPPALPPGRDVGPNPDHDEEA
jgi:hypothetical protein